MAARGKKLVTKSLPAFIARTQFGQILERVSGHRERFLVTKKGEAKAIILGVEDFLQAVVKIPPELAAIQAEAKKRGVDTLTLEEIEAEIQARCARQSDGRATHEPKGRLRHQHHDLCRSLPERHSFIVTCACL